MLDPGSGLGARLMIWRRLMLAVTGLELVPIDVLDRVGRLARAFEAQVDLFHCLYEPEAAQAQAARGGAVNLIAARVEERRRRLERLADILRDQGVTVNASVRWDFPIYEGIIRQALRHKPDLLILPALALQEAHRTLVYREQRLIAAAPCAVLFIKTREVYSKGCVVAAVDPAHAREADGDLDELAIGAAKTLAGALADVPVHLCHAESPAVDGAPHVPGEQLEAQVRRLAERHEIAPTQVHVACGTPEEVLSLCVRQARAQSLVLGVPSEPAALRRGSERLVERIECDVLVLKTHYAHPGVGTESSPAVLPQSL